MISAAEGLEVEGKEVLEVLEVLVVILRKDGMSSKCGRAANLAGNGWKAQARRVPSEVQKSTTRLPTPHCLILNQSAQEASYSAV